MGSHERRDCLAASRAVACHFAWDFVARSPFQTATERDAAHGTIAVDADLGEDLDGELAAVPLGSACTTVTAGSGRRRRRRDGRP